MEVGMLKTGTLLLARDDDEARELERQLAFRQSLGLRTERLRPTVAREREPGLAPTVRLAIEAPDDHSVDPRLVLTALRRACEIAGVSIREDARVESVELDGTGAGGPQAGGPLTDRRGAGGRGDGGLGGRGADQPGADGRGVGGRVTGVVLHGGERVSAGQVVLAAGPWTGQIRGLPAAAQVPVRPVKGQILRLRDPAGPGLLTRVARFEGGYLVPRADGRYALGATVEEKGFELSPTAGGVYELLRDASELVPGIDELRIEELSVGLRPGTPDNAPAIGRGALEGLVWATGHHRNGILLAPLTAELVTAALIGETSESLHSALAACAPARFAAAPSDSASATDSFVHAMGARA